METWYTRKVDVRVSRMLEAIQHFRIERPAVRRPFITIAREYGCQAYDVAQILVDRLNRQKQDGPDWAVYDRQVVDRVAGDLKVRNELVRAMTREHRSALEEFLASTMLKVPNRDRIFNRVSNIVRGLAWHGHVVIIGRGGAVLCAGMPGGVHLQLVAPFAWRANRLINSDLNLSCSEAEARLKQHDRERRHFYVKYLGVNLEVDQPFDLTCNNSRMSPMEVAEMALSRVTAVRRQLHAEPMQATAG
jgi:cytidylate kinase